MYKGSENNRNYSRPNMHEKNEDGDYYYMGSEYFKNSKKREPPADYGVERKKNEDSLSSDSEDKQKSFTRLCERFAEKTSMQALPYINAAKLWYAKVLWVIILLVGMAGMTLHLYYLIDQFFDYDVQVDISLGFSNLAFPAVTICNVNAVRKSQLDKTSQAMQSLVAQTDPGKLPPPGGAQGPGPGTGPAPPGRRRKRYTADFNVNFDNLTKDYDSRHRPGEKDETFKITETFKKLYMEEKSYIRRQVGHQLKDMLLQCTFGGYKCFDFNFTVVQTEEYGNCFTIQSEDLIVTNPGPDMGLSLTLYMETDEYLTGINQGYGARILVHDIDTYPFPAAEGMYVSSSFETHIGLKQVEVIRKGDPYGDCKDVFSFKQKYGAKYTRSLCQLFCQQDAYINRCGCFDELISDVYDTLNVSLEARPCRSDQEKECLSQLKANELTQDPDCPACVNPCREHQFVKSVSSRNWPTDQYANVLMSGICDRIPEKCSKMQDYNNQGDLGGLAKNFVKLVVYFEDLNYELIEEKPEIEPAQFASDVGGAIGLWIGLSLISIFEVVQLLFECCAFCAYRCKTPRKKRSKDKYKQHGHHGHIRNEANFAQKQNNGYGKW